MERELLSAVNANKFEAVRAILQNNPKVDLNKCCCLHWAITFGKLEMTNLLIDAGADINAIGMAQKHTPLMVALSHNHNSIVERLLRAGADANRNSPQSGSPIMLAYTKDMVNLLIKHGADVNARNPKGVSPLMHAISYRRMEIAQILINAGAELNCIDNLGYTALIAAVEKGDEACVRMLLKAGADTSIRAASGRSVFEIAESTAIRKLLESYRQGSSFTKDDVPAAAQNGKVGGARPPVSSPPRATAERAYPHEAQPHNSSSTTTTTDVPSAALQAAFAKQKALTEEPPPRRRSLFGRLFGGTHHTTSSTSSRTAENEGTGLDRVGYKAEQPPRAADRPGAENVPHSSSGGTRTTVAPAAVVTDHQHRSDRSTPQASEVNVVTATAVLAVEGDGDMSGYRATGNGTRAEQVQMPEKGDGEGAAMIASLLERVRALEVRLQAQDLIIHQQGSDIAQLKEWMHRVGQSS